jgi:hypothetical protein
MVYLKANFDQLKSIDSSKDALLKVFWLRFNPVKRSTAKSRKRPLPPDGAESFREFADERLV